MNTFGAVVGIDKVNGIKRYRVVIATIENKNGNTNDGQYNWAFNLKVMSEEQIAMSLSNRDKWLNVRLDGKSVKGKEASLSRFTDSNNKPFVILSQIKDKASARILGYKIATYDGQVSNKALKDVLAYADRITRSSGVPFQNAIYIAENGKNAYIKSYPDCPFIEEYLIREKNTNAMAVKRVDTAKNEKTLNKLEDIYSKEQISQLKLGKNNGVDIRIYANPQFKADQMKELREGLERKIDVRAVANPEFDSKLMKAYILDLEAGLDIKNYLNPKYTLAQQSEISLAYELGLDISKLSDPKLSPSDMAEIRERLANDIWRDELVKKDGSWT